MIRRILGLTMVLSTAMSTPGAAARAGQGLLVEAESFLHKGGWVVDQQFLQVMGSPYLLAHGLGQPVDDASTPIEISAAGSYRIWVRTKNWVPGDWEAPGRFRVAIGGHVLPAEFGTEKGWTWQDGGLIALPAGATDLKLHDLTGFDGRCDAVFLTMDQDFRPPNDLAGMRAWRRELLGWPTTPPAGEPYDVVVVGGGIAGCGAAMAAAGQGLHVALVQDRPVLGGNASSEVRVHTLGITGRAGAILNKINTHHWPNGSPGAIEDEQKRHRNIENTEGLNVFLKWRAYDAVTENNRIRAVYAQHTESGQHKAFAAPVFIDCTGDGWIGFWAGADFRYGREAYDEFGEQWEKHGRLWSPEKPDNRVMGSSLLWFATQVADPKDFPEPAWASEVAAGNAAVKGEWQWEYSSNELDAIADAEQIRDHMLQAIYGSFANARQQAKYARYQLEFVGYVLGKRESRRLMGDYIYTMNDALEGRQFPDAVVEETREIDVHYQRQYKNPAFRQDFLSTALFRKVPRYRVPFRCLYSRNIENLMMAGRCFSCSHVGLGGPRVMNTCGQMGVATGFAASLCKRYSTTPRGVYEKHLPELLALTRGPEPAAPEPAGTIRVMAPADPLLRTADRYGMSPLREPLRSCVRVVVPRGPTNQPGSGYTLNVNQPVTAYLAVHPRGEYQPPKDWQATDLTVEWEHATDVVYRHEFPAGKITVPAHTGRAAQGYYGIPHLLLLAGNGDGKLEVTAP